MTESHSKRKWIIKMGHLYTMKQWSFVGKLKELEKVEWGDLVLKKNKHDVFCFPHRSWLLMLVASQLFLFPPCDQLEFSQLSSGIGKKTGQCNTLLWLLSSFFLNKKIFKSKKCEKQSIQREKDSMGRCNPFVYSSSQWVISFLYLFFI